jgi:hypothetical protein
VIAFFKQPLELYTLVSKKLNDFPELEALLQLTFRLPPKIFINHSLQKLDNLLLLLHLALIIINHPIRLNQFHLNLFKLGPTLLRLVDLLIFMLDLFFYLFDLFFE